VIFSLVKKIMRVNVVAVAVVEIVAVVGVVVVMVVVVVVVNNNNNSSLILMLNSTAIGQLQNQHEYKTTQTNHNNACKGKQE
jgi:hypothetical protein